MLNAELFKQWAEFMRERTIRGQVVRDCEMIVDTHGDPCRVMLGLMFRENPPSTDDENERLLEVIFNEVPHFAQTKPMNPEEAEMVMTGKMVLTDEDWYLEDESKVIG